MIVAGLGAATALGKRHTTSVAASRAGIRAATQHASMVDQRGAPVVTAPARWLHDDLAGIDRWVALARPAAAEAVTMGQGVLRRLGRPALVLGLPDDRPGRPQGLDDAIVTTVLQAIPQDVRPTAVEMVRTGSSASTMALQAAWDLLQRGDARCVLVGGVDSLIDADAVEWLDEHDVLHHPATAWGVVPAEAAGFVLLVADPEGRGPADRVAVRILATGSSSQAVEHPPTIRTGHDLTAAFHHALAPLGPQQTVGRVLCDMAGDPFMADEYGFSVMRCAERFEDASRLCTPGDRWGHVGAAAGVLLLAVAYSGWHRGYEHVEHQLSWTGSWAGHRSAALLHLPSGQEPSRWA